MPDILLRLRDAYAENPAKALDMLPKLFQQYDEGKIIALMQMPLGKTLYWLWGDEIMPVRYKGINGGFMGKDKKFHVTYRMTTKKERSFPYTWHRKRGINTIPVGNERFFCGGDISKTVFLTREAAEAALKERNGE